MAYTSSPGQWPPPSPTDPAPSGLGSSSLGALGNAALGQAAKEVLTQAVENVATNDGLKAQAFVFDKEMLPNLKTPVYYNYTMKFVNSDGYPAFVSPEPTPPTMADITYLVKLLQQAKADNQPISAGLLSIQIGLLQQFLGVTAGEYSNYLNGSPYYATAEKPGSMPYTPVPNKIDQKQQDAFIEQAILAISLKAAAERQAKQDLDRLIEEANECEERIV
jgi:hypothetical protein